MTTEDQIGAKIAESVRSQEPLLIEGNGTKAGILRPVAPSWFGAGVWFLGLCIGAHAQTAADNRAATDRLLDALKVAPDEQSAGALEGQVEQTWLRAASPAVSLLLSRGLRSMQAGEDDEAVASFSDAITLQPEVAEAWHQRARARYHAGDVNGAIHDLQETIQREPRDFSAFRTLANIATAREDWKGAYAAWQKVMELDPKTPGGEDRLRLLKRRALGEDT